MNGRTLLSLPLALLLGGLLASCTSNGTAYNPPGGHTLTYKHMYLSDDSSPGHIYVYDLPVTSSSSPVATLTTPVTEPAMLFVDAKGRLFVGTYSGTTLPVYKLPLTASSSALFNLTSSQSSPASIAEDAAGNVYVADETGSGGYIDAYNGPVNAAASPSYTISNNGVGSSGLEYPYDIAVAPNGDIYASDSNDINQFTPPFSSASVPSASVTPNQDNYGLRVDSQNRVFVADATTDGVIDVYTQPFPASGNNLRSFGLTAGSTDYGMAFDGSGNLWTVDSNGVVWEIKAPITASSTATQVLTGTNGYGIAFGP